MRQAEFSRACGDLRRCVRCRTDAAKTGLCGVGVRVHQVVADSGALLAAHA